MRPDTKSYFDGEGVLALPRAAPHTLGDNILAAPILRAPVTAYSYNPKEEVAAVEDIWATGSQLSLISTLQTRSSSRFTLLGSVESLQDKWFTATVKAPGSGEETKTVNQEFAKQLTAWTFKETGVLKVGKIEHHLAQDDITAEDLNPTIYRVKNETVGYVDSGQTRS